MINTIDRGDDWATANFDDMTITYDESGEVKPLTLSDFIFERGKYAGEKVSEVTDANYLEWLMKTMTEDYFIIKVVPMRLKELE